MSVATPREVQNQLQLEEPFTVDTTPSYSTVEDYIRGSEDDLFRITGHFFRPEFVEGELVDFKSYGMTSSESPYLGHLEVRCLEWE